MEYYSFKFSLYKNSLNLYISVKGRFSASNEQIKVSFIWWIYLVYFSKYWYNKVVGFYYIA